MWHVITEKEQEEQKARAEEMFKRMIEDGREKQKARDAHEACRCPHCGRNDPLPPWLL